MSADVSFFVPARTICFASHVLIVALLVVPIRDRDLCDGSQHAGENRGVLGHEEVRWPRIPICAFVSACCRRCLRSLTTDGRHSGRRIISKSREKNAVPVVEVIFLCSVSSFVRKH